MSLTAHEIPSILRGGERLDWATLYRAFGDRLLALAKLEIGDKLGLYVEAQDVVQSVFRTFFRRARSEDGDAVLPPGTDLWHLLLVITLNKIRRAGCYHRRAKRTIRRTVALLDDAADDGGEESELTLLRMTVEDLLERVEPDKRAVVVMLLGGMSIEEISEATNRAPRTIYRTVKSFQDMIEPLLNDQ